MRKIPTDIPKSLSEKSSPRLSSRQTPWFSSTSGSRNSSCAAKNSRKTLQRRLSARDFSRKRSHSSKTLKKKPENKVISKIPKHRYNPHSVALKLFVFSSVYSMGIISIYEGNAGDLFISDHVRLCRLSPSPCRRRPECTLPSAPWWARLLRSMSCFR